MEGDPIPFPNDTIHLKGHLDDILEIALLPGGKRIVTASMDKTIRIYSISTATRLQTLRGQEDYALCLAVIDEDTIAATFRGGELNIWRLSTSSIVHRADFADPSICRSLEDGRLVLGIIRTEFLDSGERRKGSILLELHWDGKELHRGREVANPHDGAINEIAVCNGRFVSTANKSAKVWDASTFECLADLTGHTSGVGSAAMGGEYVVTGSFQELRVYDSHTFEFVRDIDAHIGFVHEIRFAENKDVVVSCGADQTIAAHSLASGSCLWRIETGCRIALETLPNGMIATASHELPDVLLVPGLLETASDPSGQAVHDDPNRQRAIKQVFISHAGPDKFPFAIPLYQELHERNISAFLDLEELQPGDDAPRRMIEAMETSPILLVITSPEYCARKWTIKELSCFTRRDKEALERAERFGKSGISCPRPGEGGRPIIIPVFYRLNLQKCKNLNFVTDVSDVDERNLRRYHEMVNRLDPELKVIRECMGALGGWTGIENDLNVTNENTEEMRKLRADLITRAADAVEKAVQVVSGLTK